MTIASTVNKPVGVSLPNWKPPPAPRREAIEGHWCRLEPLDPELHAEEIFEAVASDPSLFTYLASYGPFGTVAEYRAWMKETCLGDDPLFFAIRAGAEGTAAGVASFLRIAPASGSIEVGHILFAPSLQRTPAATEAMFLMMEKAFELGYRRYEWKCDSLNAASRAAAQRLGLSCEGVFRQATVYKGRNRDTAWYAAIDSEWPQLREAFLAWLDPGNFDEDGRQRVRLSELTAPVLKQRG
jgi:RimJ/RimL family protein N-acetyltransferase